MDQKLRRSPKSDKKLSHLILGVCGRSPIPTSLGCGGCGRGDPSATPQRALLCACLARFGGGKRAPRAGRLLPGCRASWVVRSPTPEPPVLGACGRGRLPTGCGCRWCGPGDPSPTPRRALLRGGFARFGGGMRAPGGASLAKVWGVLGWALTHARPPVLGACGQGPLPTGCVCARCWRGDLSPTPRRALLRDGFPRCGGGTRAPGGGTFLACVRGALCCALTQA